jgi:hypothetical protein
LSDDLMRFFGAPPFSGRFSSCALPSLVSIGNK